VLQGYEIEAVVHLAYMLKTGRDRHLARQVNVGATESLLRACHTAGVRQFVYLSSTTVYGAHPSYSRPYTETDAVNPVKGFAYSEQKAEAEMLVLRFGEEHPQAAVSVLRGCVIMAAGADNFIARALGKRVLPAPAGADPDMQFLHLDDYLSAVEVVLASGAKGIYNVAGDGVVRWREMVSLSGARLLPTPAALLSAAVGLSWAVRLQDDAPPCGLNFIRYPWLASTEKALTELGWKPRHTSREALQSWVDGRRRR
jgi:UDP-glucose 4-epimerase